MRVMNEETASLKNVGHYHSGLVSAAQHLSTSHG